MILLLLIIFLFQFTSAYQIKAQNSIILTKSNFTETIKGASIFVLFIEDPQNRKSFLDFWDQVIEVKQAEEANSGLKFGILDCSQNKQFCARKNITDKIQLEFYGEKNDGSKNLEGFLESTISEVLKEDEMITKLKMPGNLFVLFKVVYCPYCKEAMEEFSIVQEHFKNYPNLFVGSLDCTRHRDICKNYHALKWPKFKFIHNNKTGANAVDMYDGERIAKDIIDYVELKIKQYK